VSGGEDGVKAAGAGSPRLRAGLLALAFAALAFALYAPSLPGPFVSDDVLYLEHNEALARPLGPALRQILLEPYFVVGNWSPVHQLWLLGTWRAFGAEPALHRAANVLLHAATALALVAAIRRARVRAPFAAGAGLLFLAHPAAAEAVAWINQSKTLLATLGCLVALERWLAHLEEPRRGRLAAVTAAGVLALLAKPSAIPLVGVLAFAAWAMRAPLGRALWQLAPLAAATALSLVLGLQAQALQGGVAPWFGGSPEATARILPWLAWRYVRLAFVPAGLAHGVWPAPVEGWTDLRVLGPAAALLATAAAVAFACRSDRTRALGPAWFGAMLLPVLQVVPMINLFGDRYLYAALPGVALFVARLADDAAARRPRGRPALAAAGAAAAVAFAALTVVQARLWADPAALYRRSAAAFPLSRIGWTGLGATLHQQEDFEGAADAYLRSLAVFPNDGHVRHLLGRARLRQGDRGRALYDLEVSLRLAPNHHDAASSRRVVARLRAAGVAPVADEPPADAYRPRAGGGPE
jgi:tetratricopeptide (TPR) repeat protein